MKFIAKSTIVFLSLMMTMVFSFEKVFAQTPAFEISQNSFPSAVVGILYKTSLTATGGSGSYEWKLSPSDVLPPGLSFSQGVCIALAGYACQAPAEIFGTPTKAGTYSFTLSVSDKGQTISKRFTLVVDEAPAEGKKFVIGIFPLMSGEKRMFVISVTDSLTIQSLNDCYNYSQKNPNAPKCGKFIMGSISKSGDGGFNTGWSWHLVPETVKMVEISAEVCDGTPGDVENNLVTSPYYCPWESYVMTLDGIYPHVKGTEPTPKIAVTPTPKTVEGTVVPVVFSRNLKFGMKGEDVKKLQTILSGDSSIYPEKLITGYFGPATQRAVIKFQEKYANEILTPVGLKKGTGIVGPSTIKKLK